MKMKTEEYRANLFALRDMWNQLIPVPCDNQNLIVWYEQFADESIKKGIAVTSRWYARKEPKPTENDVERYATATMRNIDGARVRAEEIFGKGGAR